MFKRVLLLVVVVVLTAGPSIARADIVPTVAVYDFSTDRGVPPQVGEQFADAIADEMRAAGEVNVVRGPHGVLGVRATADARARRVDALLVGSVAKVGSTYGVIVQLVRASTGLVSWSTTTQAATVADLQGEGGQARQALLDQVGRISFAHPAVAPTQPSFAAGGKPAAAQPPVATATTAPGAPITVAVVDLGGSALPGDRVFVQRALLDQLRARGIAAGAQDEAPNEIALLGAQACMDTGAATIVAAYVDDDRVAGSGTTATVTLHVYDCRTQAVYDRPLAATKSAALSSEALRTAAVAALAPYLPAQHG